MECFTVMRWKCYHEILRCVSAFTNVSAPFRETWVLRARGFVESGAHTADSPRS